MGEKMLRWGPRPFDTIILRLKCSSSSIGLNVAQSSDMIYLMYLTVFSVGKPQTPDSVAGAQAGEAWTSSG